MIIVHYNNLFTVQINHLNHCNNVFCKRKFPCFVEVYYMEKRICLLGKIFCETLHVNIIKNQYQKVLTVFSTCIITGNVNVHQRVYQNKHKIHVKNVIYLLRCFHTLCT